MHELDLKVHGLDPQVEVDPEGAARRLEAPVLPQLNGRFSLESRDLEAPPWLLEMVC